MNNEQINILRNELCNLVTITVMVVVGVIIGMHLNNKIETIPMGLIIGILMFSMFAINITIKLLPHKK